MIKEIEEWKFTEDYNCISLHVIDGLKKKPNSKPLKEMRKALIDIGAYVMNLQNRHKGIEDVLKTYQDKIKHYEKQLN